MGPEYYPLVEVLWFDAVSTDVWYKDDVIPDVLLEHTLGYLVAEDSGAIHVAQHWDDECFRNLATIPREFIRSIAYLAYRQDVRAARKEDACLISVGG